MRVILLSGGDSSEREVSLRSGNQVFQALETAGHSVVAVDPIDDGFASIDWQGCDVCFLAMHGGEGEDGGIQARLDALQVPYTGSGAAASRLAMDKALAKNLFMKASVPTPEWLLLGPQDSPVQTALAERIVNLGFPLIVKPNGQGSSLGLGMARSLNETVRCVEESRQYDPQVLVERFIRGREFTVTLLGRTPLPLLEVLAPGELLDYESKYNNAATEFCFQTGLPPMKVEEIQQTAVAAAAALMVTGLSRVDLMLDAGGRPWVLEINTLPGMTAQSMAPRAAALAGYDMSALCDWMLGDALENASRSWQSPKANNIPSSCPARLAG